MEKKKYTIPVMQVEVFMANHYCSGCGDMVTYSFKCNASVGKYVWLETNGTSGVQAKTVTTEFYGRKMGLWNRTDNRYDFTWASEEKKWGTFACGDTHSVTVPKGTSIDEVFPNGYASTYSTGEKATSVRIWTDNGTDTHVTTLPIELESTPHNNHS